MAKVRNYNETDPYRAKVIRAMMSSDYVLEIEGEVIKPEGELLSLTASEALAEYGDPPRARCRSSTRRGGGRHRNSNHYPAGSNRGC